MIIAIQIILILSAMGLLIGLISTARMRKINIKKGFNKGFLIGVVTDFLDTLGIGSFATTTALFKATHFIDDDKKLPGTLNVAHAIPVLVEALFFISVVQVDWQTLVLMTTAAVLGALVGPKLTKNWHTPTVQKVLAIVLTIAAIIMVVRLFVSPGEHIDTGIHGLEGEWLVAGVVFNFIIGILMTMGLGNYAPELIFFSIAGLNPSVAFPIMMLDAALIMSTSSLAFIKENRLSWYGLFGIVAGGVVGVILAAKLVVSLDISVLKGIVILLAFFTAWTLWRDSRKTHSL